MRVCRQGTSFVLGLVVLAAPACRAQVYRDNLPASHPAIRYSDPPADDAVSPLLSRIAQGTLKLAFRAGGTGYLSGLLDSLGINPDSQMLAFAKDSFQADRISPRNPRAIYFNDEVAVGFVPGGAVLEIAALDPKQGVIFYTLENSTAGPPSFSRQEVCLRCHQGPATMGVPGIFVGSVFPNSLGVPAREGAIITDHTTPVEDRWGGWFVSAVGNAQQGRANAVAPDPAEPMTLEPLTGTFKPGDYLSPLCDMVALMTFEHQTQIANLLTRLGWEGRMGMNNTEQMDRDINTAIRYLTFAGEASLHHTVADFSTFAKTFGKRGPRDKLGRSLREFDLQTRLFRYPLSYMIYSRQFEALPAALRQRIYRGIFVLIADKERQVVFQILSDTKPDFRAVFCPGSECPDQEYF
jgi:hypothetical protein